MTPRSPGAFLLSASFHALLVAVVFVFSLESCQQENRRPRILEMVTGEGDNYGATVAPKLGKENGVKLDIPASAEPKPALPTPEPKPEPPAPEPPAPPPPTPPAKATPTPTPAPKLPEKKTPTFAQQIRRKAWAAESKGKKDAAKERAAEEKKQKDLERQKKLAANRAASPKVARIDGEGIAKGVLDGSTANKTGGANGKALSREEGAVLDAYFAMLKERVQNALDKPAGLSDDLAVTVLVHISADGRLSNARIAKSSGSDEFDHAALTAFGRVSMPRHPDNKGEDLELTLRTKDIDEK